MRLGSRAKLTIGIGLVAAGVFGFLGVRDLMHPGGGPAKATGPTLARAQPRAATVVLAMAARPIHTGETITADMIRNAAYDPSRYPNATTPLEAVGQVATRDLPAGVLVDRTAIGRESNLAIRVPMGMRAISIDTTAEIAVAGLVRPGDRVDVQVVYPGEDAINGARGNGSSRARTLLQMVPVLAVGETVIGTTRPVESGVSGAVASATGSSATNTAASASAETVPARNVTLALTPNQVAELSLAKSVGALALSLRNPDDRDQVEVAQIASSPNHAPAVVASVAPARPVAAPVAAPPARQVAHAVEGRPIELVVGGNRQTIYSGSGTN